MRDENKNLSVIIAAGGESKRFGKGTFKQFVLLNGKPLLVYSIEKFLLLQYVQEIIVVTNDIGNTKKVISDYFYNIKLPIKLVQEGKLRQNSVYNGFCVVDSSCDFVLIHDACRPLFDLSDVKKCIEKTLLTGIAILATRVVDTIKTGILDKDEIYVNVRGPKLTRNELYLVQTPQVIRYDLLSRAYEKFEDRSGLDSVYSSFTDEAGMIEHLGEKVSIVIGSRKNIKITYKEDLEIASGILNAIEKTKLVR